ncbi:MAG TPA: glycosyltransferase family 39 protein [Streptosporangiaceae bacterium]
MHGSGGPAVIDGRGGTGSSGHPAPAQPPGHAGLSGVWLPLLPAAVTLLAGLYRISGPSFSKDETATLAAVHRSFPQLVRMLGNVDVVHGAYYVLIWVVVRLFGGSSELIVRLPSVLAMAAAAYVITLLGRRLVSGWAGLAAGLTFAILPSVSSYAQDAREGALLVALAATVSYCLVRAMDAGRPGSRRGWLAGYGVTLALLGFGNLFALLLVLAHAVTLLARGDDPPEPPDRRSAPSGGQPPRTWGDDPPEPPDRRFAPSGGQPPRLGQGLWPGWLIAVGAAVIAVSPVAVVGYSQLHQITWIQPPGLEDVLTVQRLLGRTSLVLAIVVVVAVAVAGRLARGRPLGGCWPGRLVALCLPWLILPPVILLTASLAHPVYTFRYIVFCIPAAALLIGPALVALGRYAGPAALIALLVIGLPTQSFQRSAVGHGINIRRVDRIVARNREPGDALVNVSSRRGPDKGTGERTLEVAYPYGLARLRDISSELSPQQSGTLAGSYAPAQVIRDRAATVRRMWVVQWASPRPVLLLDGLDFRLVRRWDIQGLWLRLYVRDASR